MKKRRQSSRRNGVSGGLGVEQLRAITDVGPSLSDGSCVPLSDMTQRTMSMQVPITISRKINEQLVWTRAVLDLQGNLSAVAETQIASYFQLSQLPAYTSWAAIFDQYCIPVAVCQIRGSENVATVAQGGPQPRIYSVLDHDDANVISIATAKEYSSCKEQRLVDNVTRVIYPRVAIGAYSGAFTSFANQRSWIDCGSPNVQHYGLKTSIEADTRSTVGEYLLRFTIYYCFRNHH